MHRRGAKQIMRTFSAKEYENKNAGGRVKDLLSDVLLVKKTPKYDRLKNSKFIEHPYI